MTFPTLETVIGLETHVQLRTKSKMFCRCDNSGEDQEPNTTVCPVCMGHPGTLPVPNEQAIAWAAKVALALHCKVSRQSKFDRKSYFYPDLPKGYQISQFDQPIGKDGYLMVHVGKKPVRVRIERVHLEEDSAKLVHAPDGKSTLIDFNRAGTPLVEIVTKPDIQSPAVAKAFLQGLRLIMRYLGVSDADMEKGHLRCDANISLKPIPEHFGRAKKKFGLEGDVTTLFPKTEVKNLNSFKAVERALEFETKRQSALWYDGKPPLVAVTRGWDDKKMGTVQHRDKEAAHDYRYFPEPDLTPITFTKAQLDGLERDMPELPYEKRDRFESQFGMRGADAAILVDDLRVAHFFEEVVSELKAWLVSLEEVEGTEQEIWESHKAKLVNQVVSWITTKLFTLLNERRQSIDEAKITPENFAELMTMMYKRRINASVAQTVLEKMFVSGEDPSDIVEAGNLGQVSGEKELTEIIDAVINENAGMVDQFKKGKTPVLQFLIGQAMKKSKGKADPKVIRELLIHRLA